jgi:hypothetical protein
VQLAHAVHIAFVEMFSRHGATATQLTFLDMVEDEIAFKSSFGPEQCRKRFAGIESGWGYISDNHDPGGGD